MTNRDTTRTARRGLGSSRGNDPEAFGEAPAPAADASRGRHPAEGEAPGRPGADKPARTPEDEGDPTARRH